LFVHALPQTPGEMAAYHAAMVKNMSVRQFAEYVLSVMGSRELMEAAKGDLQNFSPHF
jgi:hypothetical protein